MSALRPYQVDVLERASAATEHHQSILIVSPTGTGKTCIAVEACVRHAVMGGRPLFVVPRRELAEQASKILAAHGLTNCVHTIQGLMKMDASIPNATMVVLDEARHYVAEQWGKIKTALPDAVYLGLDATPERGDGVGLAPFFTILIESISIREATEQGWLVPCEVIRPERALGVDLAQDPFGAWMQHAKGLSTVIFVRTVEDAIRLADRINTEFSRVHAAAVWGDMLTSDRDQVLADFAEGNIGVLVNVQLLTEGYDCPRIECVILARNFATAGGLLQAAGRGLRPYPGKDRCLLIDLPGCTHTLGDVDEPRTWHLDGRAARRASDSPLARYCPVCGSVTETASCAQCGFDGEMKKRKPRVLGLPMDRFARDRAKPEEQQIKALAGYIRAARSRGYKDHWAYKCWSHRYGRPVTAEIQRAAFKLI